MTSTNTVCSCGARIDSRVALATKVRQIVRVTTDVVDMEGVVRLLGGTIQGVKDGSLTIEVFDNRTFTIRGPRDRYILAHAVGHLLLHTRYLAKQPGVYRDSVEFRMGYSQEEVDANRFAMAFLMPHDRFLELANNLTHPQLADAFGVRVGVVKTHMDYLKAAKA